VSHQDEQAGESAQSSAEAAQPLAASPAVHIQGLAAPHCSCAQTSVPHAGVGSGAGLGFGPGGVVPHAVVSHQDEQAGELAQSSAEAAQPLTASPAAHTHGLAAPHCSHAQTSVLHVAAPSTVLQAVVSHQDEQAGESAQSSAEAAQPLAASPAVHIQGLAAPHCSCAQTSVPHAGVGSGAGLGFGPGGVVPHAVVSHQDEQAGELAQSSAEAAQPLAASPAVHTHGLAAPHCSCAQTSVPHAAAPSTASQAVVSHQSAQSGVPAHTSSEAAQPPSAGPPVHTHGLAELHCSQPQNTVGHGPFACTAVVPWREMFCRVAF